MLFSEPLTVKNTVINFVLYAYIVVVTGLDKIPKLLCCCPENPVFHRFLEFSKNPSNSVRTGGSCHLPIEIFLLPTGPSEYRGPLKILSIFVLNSMFEFEVISRR